MTTSGGLNPKMRTVKDMADIKGTDQGEGGTEGRVLPQMPVEAAWVPGGN